MFLNAVGVIFMCVRVPVGNMWSRLLPLFCVLFAFYELFLASWITSSYQFLFVLEKVPSAYPVAFLLCTLLILHSANRHIWMENVLFFSLYFPSFSIYLFNYLSIYTSIYLFFLYFLVLTLKRQIKRSSSRESSHVSKWKLRLRYAL